MTATSLPEVTRPTSRTAGRPTPGAGAVRAYLGLELRRMLRNRRSLVFSFVMPPVFFLLFGTSAEYRSTPVGPDTNVVAYVLVSMALYGALLTATSGGAGVAVERAQGWTRQLRLTPLNPWAYVLVKVLASMTLGAVSVVVTLVVGAFAGARMPVSAWIACALIAWFGSLVFAAFGLFMGYLLPTENVIQILGPALALLSFAGGLFMPLGDTWFATVAQVVPTYGLAELVRAPLGGGSVSAAAVVNVVAWTLIFLAGAVWRFRKDTARV
ncbi:ABC transporter permease [Promicromonospora sp. NPDC090134]|uniref:ABC transporter permease n=1 Tax=Promicromonospora sp. NPDC090134 TaxID=3364408 RepID=UPI003803A130